MLKEYRLERQKHPADFEKFTVNAGDDDVVHTSVKLLPQLEYDIAQIGKKRVIAEAWNLPQEFNAAFYFRLQGLNRTTPDSFECFLEGQGLTHRLSDGFDQRNGGIRLPAISR